MPTLLGKQIGPTGFGLMGLGIRVPAISDEQALSAMRAAIASGMTLWNGGEHYGTPERNSQTLLAKYLRQYPEDADKIVLSVKGAFDIHTMTPDGSPEGIKKSIDKILADLDGTHKIDIFECSRVDPQVPLETTLKFLEGEYVKKGIIGGIALSEVAAPTIRRAASITDIVAVEVEVSLWNTHALQNGVAAACAERDIPIVAYSPIGQGMLGGRFKSPDDIPQGDFRRLCPRFQPENFAVNMELVRQLEALAKQKGCTPAQLALSWVKSLSNKPGMPTFIPIPGATTEARVCENGVHVGLAEEDLKAIDAVLAKFQVVGDRYPAGVPTDG